MYLEMLLKSAYGHNQQSYTVFAGVQCVVRLIFANMNLCMFTFLSHIFKVFFVEIYFRLFVNVSCIFIRIWMTRSEIHACSAALIRLNAERNNKFP